MKKRKYFIDVNRSKKILSAYGIGSRELNWYTLRVSNNEYHASWDWYHTQGTVVMNENGRCRRFMTTGDVEDLAERINQTVYDKV